MRDVKTINERLREYQTEWFNRIVCPWVKKGGAVPDKMKKWVKKNLHKDEYSFSQPFFTGVYNYLDNKPLIMFVGQETNGWGNWEDFDGESDISLSQSYVMAFAENNTITKDPKKEFIYKDKEYMLYDSSPFWNFVRDICNQDIQVVWNELDKIHYRTPEKKCIKLYPEDESFLNKPIQDEKSLLRLEIETIKPKMVIFLTGPSYVNSMQSALNNKALQKPCKDQPIISFGLGPIHCRWTYHPRYLNWEKNLELKTNVENGLKKDINLYCK